MAVREVVMQLYRPRPRTNELNEAYVKPADLNRPGSREPRAKRWGVLFLRVNVALSISSTALELQNRRSHPIDSPYYVVLRLLGENKAHASVLVGCYP